MSKGRRIPWADDRIPIEQEKRMEPGDYAGPWHGMYLVRAPNGDWGTISKDSGHTITENTNGTITVSPSIQFNTGQRWHGYLINGEWRAA